MVAPFGTLPPPDLPALLTYSALAGDGQVWGAVLPITSGKLPTSEIVFSTR